MKRVFLDAQRLVKVLVTMRWLLSFQRLRQVKSTSQKQTRKKHHGVLFPDKPTLELAQERLKQLAGRSFAFVIELMLVRESEYLTIGTYTPAVNTIDIRNKERLLRALCPEYQGDTTSDPSMGALHGPSQLVMN